MQPRRHPQDVKQERENFLVLKDGKYINIENKEDTEGDEGSSGDKYKFALLYVLFQDEAAIPR